MKKGYIVAMVDVTDPEGYQEYIAANAVAFDKFGARFLVRGGDRSVVEGAMRARLVVIEFPTYQAAQDCYHSPEYARAIALREGRAIADIAILEGYDGPQPSDTVATGKLP